MRIFVDEDRRFEMHLPYYTSRPVHPQSLEFINQLRVLMESKFGMTLEETQPTQVSDEQDKQPNEQIITSEGAEKRNLLRFIVL